MSRLDKKALGRLSDDELRKEVARRRKARVRGSKAKRESHQDAYAKEVLQFYANLELEVGATLEEIDAAHERLLERYRPSRHADSPEKFRAASKLVASLTRAYKGLRAHRARKNR